MSPTIVARGSHVRVIVKFLINDTYSFSYVLKDIILSHAYLEYVHEFINSFYMTLGEFLLLLELLENKPQICAKC